MLEETLLLWKIALSLKHPKQDEKTWTRRTYALGVSLYPFFGAKIGILREMGRKKMKNWPNNYSIQSMKKTICLVVLMLFAVLSKAYA